MGGMRSIDKSIVRGHLGGPAGMDSVAGRGSGGGGSTVWTPGTYTKGLWILDMASGNAVDEVSGITLPVYGAPAPTYEVSGTGDYASWKGIQCTHLQGRFWKNSGTSDLNLGASDHAVVQTLLRYQTEANSQPCFLCDPCVVGSQGYLYQITKYGGVDTNLYWAIRSATLYADTVFTRPASPSAGDTIRQRLIINKTTNAVTMEENGTALGSSASIGSLGAVSNNGLAIGGLAWADDNYNSQSQIFAVKIDIGSDAAVLSIDEGYPSG